MSNSMIVISSVLGFSYLGYKLHEYIFQVHPESTEKRGMRVISVIYSTAIGSILSPLFIKLKEDICK